LVKIDIFSDSTYNLSENLAAFVISTLKQQSFHSICHRERPHTSQIRPYTQQNKPNLIIRCL